MADELRRLSDELASNPGSLAFLRLGELLRQRGELDNAARVAARGRERHPGLAAAHDLAARVSLDRGDPSGAAEAWHAVLRIEPEHAGAHKGLGFVAYRAGHLRDAAEHLARAAAADPADASIASALETVRGALRSDRPTPPASRLPVAPPRRSSIGVGLFSDITADAETVLLVDRNGLVLAGSAPVDGVDQSADIGARLSGVSEEADRAMRHLDLGGWTSLMIEAPAMTTALAPTADGGVVLIAAPRSTPLGLVMRMLDRAAERSRAWLSEGA